MFNGLIFFRFLSEILPLQIRSIFQVMACWKEQVLGELKNLDENLLQKKSQLENAMDDLENIKGRDGDRKSILLSEIKSMLRVLEELDKKVTKDIKAEVFDTMMKMNKLKEDIAEETRATAAASGAGEAGGEVVKRLNSLRSRVGELQEVPSLEVARAPAALASLGSMLAKGGSSLPPPPSPPQRCTCGPGRWTRATSGWSAPACWSLGPPCWS
jgi:hypothetical protein